MASPSSTKYFLGLRILSDGSLSYTLTNHRPTLVCITEQEKEEVLKQEQSFKDPKKGETTEGSDT
jgi:hypothetical protein